MIRGFMVLLACQLAGEGLMRFTGWPVPGPVWGMLILLAAVVFARGAAQDLNDTAQGLLKHLALLYVPAGVGLVTHLSLIAEKGLVLVLILFISTALAMIVTGWTYQKLSCPHPGEEGA